MALRSENRLPWGVPAAVAAAWALLLVGEASGQSQLLDHDAVFDGGRPWAALVLFLLGWQVMVAAMMLPASFPAIRKVASRRAGVGAFLAGFGLVWTVFGWAALSLDSVVHRTVEHQPWLAARPYLLATGLLVVVGLAQLAPLKGRCLAACRQWAPGPPDGRALRPLFADGARYGRLGLSCDGGLMLLMLGAGTGSVAWMTIVGGVMAVERSGRLNGSVHHWTGAVLLVWAAVMVWGRL